MPARAKKEEPISVTAPNIRAFQVRLNGETPYMQARFSEKAKNAMMAAMDGSVKQGVKRVREARNYDEDYHGAMHLSTEGWIGIPCSSLRAALISACRLTGATMVRAKLSLFVEAEGIDKVDGQPLFRIYGDPERCDMPTRNANGAFDVRVRPMWREWYALPVIRYDEDQFPMQAVLNLLRRVGIQVGLGEGRPDSRASAGLGYGTFTIQAPDSSESIEEVEEAEEVEAAPKKRDSFRKAKV